MQIKEKTRAWVAQQRAKLQHELQEGVNKLKEMEASMARVSIACLCGRGGGTSRQSEVSLVLQSLEQERRDLKRHTQEELAHAHIRHQAEIAALLDEQSNLLQTNAEVSG